MPMNRDYDTLVLAGYGAMGQAFLALCSDFIAQFNSCVLLDCVPLTAKPAVCDRFIQQDIHDRTRLRANLEPYTGRFLFVNLTAGTDTYQVRQVIADLNGAYIDTACSMMHGSEEFRYSKLMPYTLQSVANTRPHFLCCGVNPGMIELITRKLIAESFPEAAAVDVHFYEWDQLQDAPFRPGKTPVSWSPATLIDEVLLSPSLVLAQGVPREGPEAPTRRVTMNWFGQTVEARLVGHEEIWNLQSLADVAVQHSSYAYAFGPAVMAALSDSERRARASLYVPERSSPVQGIDSLAVKVTDCATGRSQALMWSTDHAQTYAQHQINAVQFQVCSSLRLFCELLLRTPHTLSGEVFSVSTLDLASYGWETIEGLLAHCHVIWTPIEPDAISLQPYNAQA